LDGLMGILAGRPAPAPPKQKHMLLANRKTDKLKKR